MLKVGEIEYNNDGREDIILKIEGVDAIIIKEEFYKKYETYQNMQSPEEQGKFLMAMGILVLEAAGFKFKGYDT